MTTESQTLPTVTVVNHACQNDFRIVRLSARTKTEFKKAGYDTNKLKCERVGWKHYGRKSYQVVINGYTGTIAGERPYSFLKIFFAVLAVVVFMALVALYAEHQQLR